jgi:hypothetical protein
LKNNPSVWCVLRGAGPTCKAYALRYLQATAI